MLKSLFRRCQVAGVFEGLDSIRVRRFEYGYTYAPAPPPLAT
jgi:hypothetical protein